MKDRENRWIMKDRENIWIIKNRESRKDKQRVYDECVYG